MARADDTSTLLRAARVVTPEGVIDSGVVLVKGGTILSVADAGQSPPADNVLDLEGCSLFPGFIDIHIHGAAGVDTLEASGDDLRRVAEFLARHGVTAWLPTLVPASAEQYEQAISAITELIDAETLSFGARALGVHYEGPFVNEAQCGALHREHFRSFSAPQDIDALPSIKRDGAVHFTTLAPEIDGGVNLIRELCRRGWITSIGHTRATVEILNQALTAGARHMTHFMNAMAPLHHRAPGPIGWGLFRDDVTCDVIADGVHLDPLVLKLILRAKTAGRVSLISDAIAAAGLGDGNYQIWGEQIVVEGGRTRNRHGSIAGSVITMLDAVRMMLSLGVAEVDVAQMAATNPARLLKIDHECGAIAEGRRADLVALNQTGDVRMTMIGGVVREFS